MRSHTYQHILSLFIYNKAHVAGITMLLKPLSPHYYKQIKHMFSHLYKHAKQNNAMSLNSCGQLTPMCSLLTSPWLARPPVNYMQHRLWSLAQEYQQTLMEPSPFHMQHQCFGTNSHLISVPSHPCTYSSRIWKPISSTRLTAKFS